MLKATSEDLVDEYRHLVEHECEQPTRTEIAHALVAVGEWTPLGAEVILHLAEEYGAAVLRNALALAIAMGIEDGHSGL